MKTPMYKWAFLICGQVCENLRTNKSKKRPTFFCYEGCYLCFVYRVLQLLLSVF